MGWKGNRPMSVFPAPRKPSVETRPRPVAWWRPGVVGLVFALVLVPLSIPARHSGNVWSRYMAVESIVERGTLAVERSPLRAISGSPDLIRSEGHLYSDKPPVLSALAALAYAPMRWGGWRLAGSPEQFTAVNAVLVSLFAGGGSALAVAGLRIWLQAAPLPALVSDALALVLALCSPLLTYGVTFNNHSLAAGLVTIALVQVLEKDRIRSTHGRHAIAGLLSGLAAVVDLPAGGLTLAILLVCLVTWERRVPWMFLVGMVPPLVLHAGLQIAMTGSPLPAEMTPRVFDYPGSYWNSDAGRWREPGPRWRFGLELLFGFQGWLTVCPTLIFGLLALGRIIARRDDPLRSAALPVGLMLLVLVIYYTWLVRRTDFAGLSFGTRHLLPLVPTVLAFAVIGAARWRSRVGWTLLAGAVVIGGVYAYAGMRDPWSRVERREDSGLHFVKPLTLYPRSSYAR